MQIYQASRKDITALSNFRLEVLRAVFKLDRSTSLAKVFTETQKYYEVFFDQQTTYLAYDKATIIGSGSICYYDILPMLESGSGKKARIMNVYTHPTYRNQGIASQLIACLIKDAHERGIDTISLSTTDMGKKVYEQFGFVEVADEMLLKHHEIGEENDSL
jgi:GNAT superfamily N-acetyltransferase